MRIQKFLSSAGFCSRRKAEEYISQGLVTVNGKKVEELGTKIDIQKDEIKVNGKKIEGIKEEKIYLVLNKPKGYVSSCSHKNQKILLDLINVKERVYPVGRLDKDSTGLILLTNDGDLHYKLSHPSFDHEKEYEVILQNKISDDDLKKMGQGVVIDRRKTRTAKVKRIDEKSFFITLKEGRNRQIRKMAEALENNVVSLKRIRIGNIKLKNLKEGSYRFLKKEEIDS